MQLRKFLLIALTSGLTVQTGQAQPSPSVPNGGPSAYSFIDYQRSFPRPGEALQRKEDTLRKQFAAKKLTWPARYVYIRSFKYDSQLEVWVKDKVQEPFRLFKTYKVCALAGTLGPKRMEGDYQVPEGFYHINVFNPRSNYYLSLGLNYPNASDRILSDSLRPGGDIYIHGSCVTVGCIPITDQQIDELYILAAHAKDQGQDFIPVHIFPVRFNVPSSVAYLENLSKEDLELKRFAHRMEQAFDYFEKHHQPPVVMIGPKGEYLINDAPPRKLIVPVVQEQPVKKPPVVHRTRSIPHLADAVHQWPQYPGGLEAFQRYLDQLGSELAVYLPKGVRKAFLQVEFVIDTDGLPVNFRVLRGVKDGDELQDELIGRMENMGVWKPALLNEKPVAKRLVQTITVETRN